MNICIISYDYPDKNRSVFPFVKQLVEEWVRQGHNCCVIAPYSITNNKKLCKLREDIDGGNGKYVILRPIFVSCSNLKIMGFSPSLYFHKLAVHFAFKYLPFELDVIYGHFWNSGIEGYSFAKEHNLPLYVASGESVIPSFHFKKAFSEYLSGCVCVSTKNKDESIERGLTTENKCIVLPNAIDSSLFFAKDKTECRKKVGLPENVFIIAVVGWFNERKGTKRVSEAINMIKTQKVYSVFIGSGKDTPDCSNILFLGSLSHSKIPDYLNAADVFVLPTLNEGCCNAVIEAMACGLPIISSNLPFNWDVLDNTNSILIDPNDISQISNAIMLLYNNKKLRSELRRASLKKVSELTIDKRAQTIIDFFKDTSNITK
jgi:teichuronic acid biosynthesis glycosyltransferase TuaC